MNAKKYEIGFKSSGIQTYQILTNDDEVCKPSLSSILLAVTRQSNFSSKVTVKKIKSSLHKSLQMVNSASK